MLVPAGSLAQICEAGRAAYPAIAATNEQLHALLAERTPAFPADLFLAAAALAGDRAALDELDRVLAQLRPAVLGMVRDHDADELIQELRVRTVVGAPGAAPTLTRFEGRGPLRVWLRVALLRAALDLRRRVGPVEIDEHAWLAVAADTPPPNISRETGAKIRAALERAIASLPHRDRLILRQHLLDGLGPPELATLYGVHRVTTFRWLATIKQRVLAEIRGELASAFDSQTLASILRHARGNLVPTVERVLLLTPES